MEFKKRKIGRILRLLTKQDIYNFKLFLDSPYFLKPDQGVLLKKLFDCLLRYSKSLKVAALTEEYLNDKVLNGEPLVPGKIDKLIASLNQYLIQFLGIENQKKPNKYHLAALEILRKRDGLGLWGNLYKKLQKDFRKNYGKGDIPSFEFLKLELEKFEFQNLDPLSTTKQSYSEILDALDRFYKNYLLDIGIQILAHNKFIIPVELESRFTALRLLLTEKGAITKNPEFRIKQQAFALLSDHHLATKNEIEDLLNQLENTVEGVNEHTENNIRSIARNLAIHLYNSGALELEEFIFNLYREDVAKGAVFYNSKILGATVNNISTFALRQRQFDWLDTFLQSQKDNILEEFMSNFIIQLNRAKLLFFQGKFKEVLEVLIFDIKDFYLKTSARVLEVMTYYELKSEQLQYKIEAYKIYIYRLPKDRVSAKFITGHNNFIDILKNINHPRTLIDERRIEKIKVKIINAEILAERSWLLEKISEAKVLS